MAEQDHPNGDDAADALGTWIQSIGWQADRTAKKLANLAAQATSTTATVQTAAQTTAAAVTNMTAGVELDTTHGGHPSGPYSQWHNDHPRMGQDLLAQITRSTR